MLAKFKAKSLPGSFDATMARFPRTVGSSPQITAFLPRAHATQTCTCLKARCLFSG